MKSINFVNPVPEKTKQEVRRWILISGALFTCLLLYITGSTLSQFYLYRSLVSQKKNIAPSQTLYVQTIQSIKEKEITAATQKQKLVKIQRYQRNPKSPLQILAEYTKRTKGTSLQACNISPHSIEITFHAPSIQNTQNQIKQIESIPNIQNVELVSLQRQNNTINTTIRAQVTKA